MRDQNFWDVIVVGGGLAGSVCAGELSNAGLTVLVIEAGSKPTNVTPVNRTLLTKIKEKLIGSSQSYFHPSRWPEEISVSGENRKHERFPAVLGTGPGGGSLVYAAALGRFRSIDFSKDSSSECGGLPNSWPIKWDDFRSFYAEAEQLMRVAGTPDETDPQGDMSILVPPPPLGPRNAALAECLQKNGRHPFRVHVGFDYKPGCSECLGHPCNRGCKADGFNRALQPALQRGRVKLLEDAHVQKIEVSEQKLTVLVSCKDDEKQYQTGHVIVTAGALQTPRILANSPTVWPEGKIPKLLGRGLMFHAADIFAVIEKTGKPNSGPQKSLAFRDHYTQDGVPLGEVQSIGQPITTGSIAQFIIDLVRRSGFGWLGPLVQLARIPAFFGSKLFRNAVLFATNLEDFPYEKNRVCIDADSIEIEYTTEKELLQRAEQLRELIRSAFSPNRVVFLSPPAQPNWGHPCGTCRMGNDPTTSVTDPFGRLWAEPRIHVADASAFPSSGGANPSLTIIANAIRISRSLAQEIKSAEERS